MSGLQTWFKSQSAEVVQPPHSPLVKQTSPVEHWLLSVQPSVQRLVSGLQTWFKSQSAEVVQPPQVPSSRQTSPVEHWLLSVQPSVQRLVSGLQTWFKSQSAEVVQVLQSAISVLVQSWLLQVSVVH